MSNSIAPGSSADINVKVTALTTNPNVPVTYKTIILKKNLVNGVNTLTQEMMSTQNTRYVIKYDYVLGEVNTREVVIGSENSVVINGVTYYYVPFTLDSNRMLHVSISDTATSAVSPSGCVFLNSELNTVISNDIVYGDQYSSFYVAHRTAGTYQLLENSFIRIPANSVLKFEGGSISNGALCGTLNIDAPNVKIFDNITFNAAEMTNLMNICWFGAVGDYESDTQYTDNTAAIQAAINTDLGLYIPAGKYGVSGNLTIRPGGLRFDNSYNFRFKSIQGDGIRHSWLVACGTDNENAFISVNWLVGDVKDIYITTGTNSRRKYGLEVSNLIGGCTLDVAIYGNFSWCSYMTGGVQDQKFRLRCSKMPECGRTLPDNGCYFDFSYCHGADIDVVVEYVNVSGTCLILNNSNGTDNKLRFLVESTHNTDVYAGTIAATGFHIEKSYTECDHTIVFNGCSNMLVTHSNIQPDMRNCSSCTLIDTAMYPSSEGNKEIYLFGSSSYTGHNFSNNIIHISSLNAGLHSLYTTCGYDFYSYRNLISNKYNLTGYYNNRFVIVGKGFADDTHYVGMNHCFKCTVTNLGAVGYSFYLKDNRAVDILKMRKGFTVSAFIKPVNPDTPIKRVLTNILGVSGNLNFGSQIASVGNGWYRSCIYVNLERWENSINWDNFSLNICVNTTNNAGMEYYIADVSVVPGPNIPMMFSPCVGEDADVNMSKSGTFANKPVDVEVGFEYFCTDKQTTEGATNGIIIYHKGSNVWVDALGRVVS